MKRYGGTLNEFCQEKKKKAGLEKLHTAWSWPFDILEKAKLWRQQKASGGHGPEGNRGRGT